MPKPLKILLPLDFSRHSLAALRCAASLQGPFKASVLILHVVPSGEMEELSLFGGEPGEFLARRLAEAKGEIDKICTDFVNENPGLKVTAHVCAGIPFREICHFAECEHVQLIVIGTHGRTGLSHLLIGSTAERVVQHASCPVLSLKPHFV